MSGLLDFAGNDYIGRAAMLEWSEGVAKRGGLAVTLGAQAGKFAGLPGERFAEPDIKRLGLRDPQYWSTVPANRPAGAPPVNGTKFGYYLAPQKILALGKIQAGLMQAVIAEGKVAEAAESVATAISGFVGKIIFGVIVAVIVGYIVTHMPKADK